jgi:hypothetical protein
LTVSNNKKYITWSLSLSLSLSSEEHRLTELNNRTLVPKGEELAGCWAEMHIEELTNFHSSLNVTTV